MASAYDSVKNFCRIQLQLLKNRRAKLRKELLDCKIQEEFLLSTLSDLEKRTKPDD